MSYSQGHNDLAGGDGKRNMLGSDENTEPPRQIERKPKCFEAGQRGEGRGPLRWVKSTRKRYLKEGKTDVADKSSFGH